ncbi:MAG TPA: ATP-binding protein [Ktedonobacteraceae bacterium]|nr:ATP-binding protein [Ktedonobacteraceae bacterium]
MDTRDYQGLNEEAMDIPSSEKTDPHGQAKSRWSWISMHRWFLSHTFAPPFLPERWSHPSVGYLVAVLLQMLVVTVMIVLAHIFPSFRFDGSLFILMVMFIALNWGAGPAVIATLTGAILLMMLLIPPYFAFDFTRTQDVIGVGFYLAIGLTISVFASQKEQARRSAEELRRRLAAIIEIIPDALSIHDSQGKTIRLNAVAREAIDKPIHTRYTFSHFIHADGIRTVTGSLFPIEELPINHALKGESASAEMCYQDRRGIGHYVKTTAAPFFSAQGSVEGVVVISHDITTLRQAERDASERANRLEAILEAVADALIVYDREGRVVQANTTARNLFNLDHLSSDLSPSFHEDNDRNAHEELGQIVSPKRKGWPLTRLLNGEVLDNAHTVDIWMHTRDEREVEMNISGAPVRNQAGHIIGGVLICRDVTARRTAELERARMLIIVTHEIKTPLTAMKLQTYVLKRQIADGVLLKTHDLEDVEYDMKRIEYLINDLLDAARLGIDQLAFEMMHCNLVKLCKQAAREQMIASARTVTLDLPETPVIVEADPARINQVLVNLLSNALKYSPDGADVTLRLRQEGCAARVLVEDTGPGIPQDAVSRLFEQFYRAPGIRVRHGSGVGLGLGLYICRKLIERQGGHIGVESIPGKGSTFWFTLPLLDLDQ